jgi:hypothetical protein
MDLAFKSYNQDTLLLNFKITQKAFVFKPDSNNQSCRAKLLEYNKTSLTICGVFYNFLWIFKVGWFEMGGFWFSTERPLERFESLQLDPWPGYTGMPIGGDQIPARGAHRRWGESGGTGSGAHGGHEGGRCSGREERRRRADGEQGRAAELRGAAIAFRWPEGRRVAGK